MMELFGYKIIKGNRLDTSFFDKMKSFRHFFDTNEPITIFDIGANTGQSVRQYKSVFPRSKIHSFEPLHEPYQQLQKTGAEYSDVICNQMAVANEVGSRDFYKNTKYSPSSGFLKVNTNSQTVKNKIHPKDRLDEVDTFSKETVSMVTLDEYTKSKGIPKIDILKIDTQGFEKEVFEGAKRLLEEGQQSADKGISFILTEIIFDDIYERPSSFLTVEQALLPHGFSLYDISHIYKDLKRGRTHWVDAIYINRNHKKI